VTEVRELRPADRGALLRFLAGLPEGERRWFKHDVLDGGVVAGWLGDDRSRRVVAVDGGEVRAYAAVEPGAGWSAHVAELVLIVATDARRQGLGTLLGRRALAEAARAGVRKVVVEVVADEAGAVALFGRLGFEAEAVLRDHVRDRTGRLRDLLVLSHLFDETWEVLAATGVDAAVAPG